MLLNLSTTKIARHWTKNYSNIACTGKKFQRYKAKNANDYSDNLNIFVLKPVLHNMLN